MTDWRRKHARDAIRAREKAELARLRLELEHAKARRRELVKAARRLCRQAKEALKVKLKERRRLERERLRAEFAAARKSERGTCRARAAVARRRGSAEVARAATAILEIRSAQKLQRRQALRKLKTSASVVRDRRAESTEEARRDIPEELQGLWDVMASKFKGNARMSRAEQFIHWAHENPSEVVALQSSAADREVARLVREHEAAQRKSRMRKTRAEIDAELRAAGVPF